MTTIKLKIRLYGDPCLRKKSIPVPEVGPPERALIQSMMATMHEHKGIGLAAPQVCIHQRIFVADIGEGPLAFVNPKIIRYFGSGVLEVVSDHQGETFRAVYTVRLAGKIYVLHVFQKKSKKGLATPKSDLDLIRQRRKRAMELHASQES